jgi:hypothetical protein
MRGRSVPDYGAPFTFSPVRFVQVSLITRELFPLVCSTYMVDASSRIICDGCGLPASPDHISERVARLEFATRFRPVHINTLFVAAAPLSGPENDFYMPPESQEFFAPFMKAIGVSDSGEGKEPGADARENNIAKLLEFQRRGNYLAYLAECQLSTTDTTVAAIARLASTLVRRIQFNYRPKHIAILDEGLSPLIGILDKAGMGPLLSPDGQPIREV